MEGHDKNAQREMEKCIEKAADFTLTMQVDEELNPDARLNDVRYANYKEADDRELGNRQLHDSVLDLALHKKVAHAGIRTGSGSDRVTFEEKNVPLVVTFSAISVTRGSGRYRFRF